jgi:hypothetical protein
VRPRPGILIGLLLAATCAAAGGGQGVANARLETRSAAGGLEPAVRAVVASSRGPVWIGWAVPTTSPHSACCWSSQGEAGRVCGCRLEGSGGHGTFEGASEATVRLEGDRRVRVLLRASEGKLERVRVFSEDCPLDAGGLAFVWLEGVRPAESVAFLAAHVGDRGSGHDFDDSALAAIARHADPSTDEALERFVGPEQPRERRRQAAFWLGQTRGARGCEILSRLLRDDADPGFREHVVFALSQSREPRAVDRVIEAARRDPSAGVRGQALFWLAQTAARRAGEVIRTALDDDPEVEVKKKAVFALSQLPKDEGVPLLIGLALSHRSYEVRKQAMFWLGQSGDPRALAFFEEVLAR